ncbi:MAG TPA: DUF6624 domain-containing protein [Chitinophaga sp.]|uniref:DUF6624 domain-containing protein n=1 Tax=Chitinophaga sp. TaxID=1869181 RepID=UPI002CA65AD2|nr:DUF6624 domain-containing protein [Chitinophaga sp.]HVI47533.1 DUF6624 domain-containing protein [Chitinophaga sp.]
MKKIFAVLWLLASNMTLLNAQSMEVYKDRVKKAQSLYEQKQYRAAAVAYNTAFTEMGRGMIPDRYNAACSWALAGEKDSAFSQLSRIVLATHYSDYLQMNVDPDLAALRNDARWEALLDMIRSNRQAKEPVHNQELLYTLDSVYILDQRDRRMLEQQNGAASPGVITLKKNIVVNDSLNLITVKAILDKHGWPPRSEIGDDGARTIFLVIQHADYLTQKQYLGRVKEAVDRKDIPSQFACLLTDRILMQEGKPQIYGSQVVRDSNTGKYIVYRLADPENVDKRRAAAGMIPIADYVRAWGITWKSAEK